MAMFRSSRRDTAPDYDLLMPDEPIARQNQPRARRDVVDVDFITLKETAKRDYENDNRRASFQQRKSKAVDAWDAFQAMIAWVDRKLSSLSVDGYSAIVAAAVVGVFLASGGFAMVPQEKVAVAAQPAPLSISHISATPQDAGGMDVIVISGVIENNSQSVQAVPSLKADLFAKGEKVASMLIEPPVTEIAAGLSHGFSAKLRYPGGKKPQIKLSFTETGVSDR